MPERSDGVRERYAHGPPFLMAVDLPRPENDMFTDGIGSW